MAAWTVEYYQTAAGNVPVADWLAGLPARERADALRYIDQLALLGTEARPPLVKPLGDKLYELRWKSGDKQHRIAYVAAAGRTFVLLHAFIKKTRATPRRDLDLARARLREYDARPGR